MNLSNNKQKYTGAIVETNCGTLVITEYINPHKVNVRFINTGYETSVRLDHILDGTVRDRLLPSIFGVGVVGDEKLYVNGKATREYTVWKSMLGRCYYDRYKQHCPSYENCFVTDNFKYLPYFTEWCNDQVGFNSLDNKGKYFALDKDILSKSNKVYSEDTCCFVPAEINALFTKSNKIRGEYSVGVYFYKQSGKFAAQAWKNGKQRNLGYYNTSEEAFFAYKEAKEKRIKDLANKWRDQFDLRVYKALMNYEVEITD